VRDVLAAETGAAVMITLRKAEKLQAELVGLRAVLRYLHRRSAIAEPEQVRGFLLANHVLPGTVGAVEYGNF
jgi:hypothetical protein